MIKPELLGTLLGLVTHDLRNPLSALQSNAGFLASVLQSEDSETLEALADIGASCDSLSHIIDNLELVAFVLDGRAPRERAALPLAPCMEEALNRVRLSAQSHRVELVSEPPARELKVSANREMLLRALSNLIRNAIQHSPEGSTVTVKVSTHQGQVVIRIQDFGVCLSPDHRESAFTAEGQLVSKGAIGGRYGRGLGLLCARVAAELSGAEITAIGDRESGNAFELRLVAA